MIASCTSSDLVSQCLIFVVVNHEQVYRKKNHFSQKIYFTVYYYLPVGTHFYKTNLIVNVAVQIAIMQKSRDEIRTQLNL